MTAPAPSPPERWWRYVRRRQLCCPAGHHLPESQRIPEYGFVRCCKHDCGKWVFVYAFRGGSAIVAEVSLHEIDELSELHTPTAMLDYLGILQP